MNYEQSTPSHEFLEPKSNKPIFLFAVTMSVLYFLALAFWFPKGNPVLFWALIVGEVFHLWQVATYVFTVWDTSYTPRVALNFFPAVDVFITVAGEPTDIVETTAQAALAMDYPNFHVYLLNDGYVAKKENWKEMEILAERLNISCITRKIPGGAKAGNINNTLKQTTSPLVAVFDADQVPHKNFLKKMTPYFEDEKMGFVQSPQYYKNAETNEVTGGAWEQQELFFGPICRGKNRMNATFMAGTNMVIRREAIEEVGGMCETNIAEDFLTSLFMHEHGWKSAYVPEVLAEGLAPEDFLSYTKQQFRWARGSLEVVFKFNPLFRKGLSWKQKIQYLSSASFFLSGIIVVINSLLPIIYFFTGLIPLQISTMALATVFLPYIFLTIYTLQVSSNFSFTFRALAYSMASFSIHLKALWTVLLNKKSGFDVTPKKALKGNFIHLVIPHIGYLVLVLVGVGYAVVREGMSASVISNLAWAIFNAAVFIPFILAALPAEEKQEKALPESLQSPTLGRFPTMDLSSLEPPITNPRVFKSLRSENLKRPIVD